MAAQEEVNVLSGVSARKIQYSYSGEVGPRAILNGSGSANNTSVKNKLHLETDYEAISYALSVRPVWMFLFVFVGFLGGCISVEHLHEGRRGVRILRSTREDVFQGPPGSLRCLGPGVTSLPCNYLGT